MTKRFRVFSISVNGDFINKYQYGFLIAITLLAFVLRFYKLGVWSFWIDEIFSIRDSLRISIFNLGGLNFLRYLILKPALTYLDVNELNARLIPALIGTVSIPLLYLVIYRVFGFFIACFTAAILAISPWHIYWSQNVRFYTLLLLFYNLSFLLFYLGVENDSFKSIIASFLFGILAVLTHPTAAMIFPIEILYLISLKVFPGSKPPGYNRMLFIPLLILPLGYIIFDGFRVLRGQNSLFSELTAKFFAGQLTLHGIRLMIGVGFYIGLPLLIIAIITSIHLLVERRREGLYFLLGATLPLIVLFAPVSQTRYAFYSLPCWAILGSIGIRELFIQIKHRGKILATGVLLLLLIEPITQDYLYYQYQNGRRTDWKQAFMIVRQKKSQEDLIVTTWPELGEYYLREEVLSMGDMTPEIILNSRRRIWFVNDNLVNPTLAKWLRENVRLIEVLDIHVPGKVYDLRVYLYEPERYDQFEINK